MVSHDPLAALVLSPAEGPPSAPAAGNDVPLAPVETDTAAGPLTTAEWDDIQPVKPIVE